MNSRTIQAFSISNSIIGLSLLSMFPDYGTLITIAALSIALGLGIWYHRLRQQEGRPSQVIATLIPLAIMIAIAVLVLW